MDFKTYAKYLEEKDAIIKGSLHSIGDKDFGELNEHGNKVGTKGKGVHDTSTHEHSFTHNGIEYKALPKGGLGYSAYGREQGVSDKEEAIRDQATSWKRHAYNRINYDGWSAEGLDHWPSPTENNSEVWGKEDAKVDESAEPTKDSPKVNDVSRMSSDRTAANDDLLRRLKMKKSEAIAKLRGLKK